ncbi:dimethylargininase [Thioalkalivibrio sp. ALJ15]|uniref:dimethylargininase n=1 Tax=Thioalkalivibrio sp. ALJ15 TaxID=748652 RepID=UPI00350EB396
MQLSTVGDAQPCWAGLYPTLRARSRTSTKGLEGTHPCWHVSSQKRVRTDPGHQWSTTMAKSVLMCRPEHFAIHYEINPWMDLECPVCPDAAARQWEALYQLYTQTLGWEVHLIPPVEGFPDMVFTANGALVVGDKVALPTFRHPERQGETWWFESWLREQGFTVLYQPRHDFEGEGDALIWNDTLFAGYPWRSDQAAHAELASFLDLEVVSLQLTDARFYHLDTAFTVVDHQTVALYPPAFTHESLEAVRHRVPNVIEANEADALAYGLNAVSDGERIVLSDRATGLAERYRQHGMEVHLVAIDEFQKSGGGMKCLTLDLKGRLQGR